VLIGVGCDIVAVARIRSAIDKHGTRFLHRVYSENEMAYAEYKQNPLLRYAKYWAAKEAGYKALSLPRPNGVSWQDLQVEYLESGQPFLMIGDRVSHLLYKFHGPGEYRLHLSMSDEVAHALAFATLEKL
jgi:holo-[acyl-carrier protein] synthase